MSAHWFQDVFEQTKGFSKVNAANVNLPSGKYQVKLTDVTLSPNKKGNPCFTFSFDVVTGESTGRKHKVFKHLSPGSPKTMEFLKTWMIALFLITEDDDEPMSKFALDPDGNTARYAGDIDTDSIHEIVIREGKSYKDDQGREQPGNPETYYNKLVRSGAQASAAPPARKTRPPDRPGIRMWSWSHRLCLSRPCSTGSAGTGTRCTPTPTSRRPPAARRRSCTVCAPTASCCASSATARSRATSSGARSISRPIRHESITATDAFACAPYSACCARAFASAIRIHGSGAR